MKDDEAPPPPEECPARVLQAAAARIDEDLRGAPATAAAAARPHLQTRSPSGFTATATGARQGLPLVHFSTQPEPLLSLKHIETTRRIPQKVCNVEPRRGRV